MDNPSVRIFDIEEDKVTISAQTILDDSYLEDAKFIAEQMEYFNLIWDDKGTTLSRNFEIRLSNESVKA